MQIRQWTSLAALAALVACGSTEKEETGTDDTGADDTGTPVEGFSVTGTIVDFNTGDVADGTDLCVSIVDPTGAITGGKYSVLASGAANADGTFAVAGVQTASAFGILMLVTACDGDTTNVMYSATGISKDDYAKKGTGDTIADRNAWVIKDGYGNTLDTDLAAAGYVGDSLTVDGALIGFVYDDTGAVLGDATVFCDKCGADAYYWGTGDATFSDAGVPNTATDTASLAKWVLPAAPIFTYYAAADGYEFDSLLAGTMSGMAVFVSFSAN